MSKRSRDEAESNKGSKEQEQSDKMVPLSPEQMEAYLAGADGQWLNRSWADVIQRVPPIQPCRMVALKALFAEMDIIDFMYIYNLCYSSMLTSRLEDTTASMGDYFTESVRKLATIEVMEDTTVVGLAVTYGSRKTVECCFLMSVDARREYDRRRLRMSIKPFRPLDDRNRPVILTDTPDVLTLLAGESGSGKTTLILASGDGLYFTASHDFAGICERVLSECVLNGETVKRNQLVARFMTAKIVSLLATAVPDLQNRHGHLDLLVALDEMGGRPNFVRGLCAVRDEICMNVNTELHLKESTIRITFVVAGTGMDTQATQPGSLPTTYRVLTMPASELIPKHLVSCVRLLGHDFHLEIAKVIESSPDAYELTKNPRFAAALWSMIKSLHAIFIRSARSAEALLSFLLQGAAATFKSLNSMNSQSVDDVQNIYQSALRLVFSLHSFRQCVPEGVIHLLVGKFGVLKDRARWFARNQAPHGFLAYAQKDDLVLAGPPFRFEMSSAQQLLFRMHYGLHALPDATWWGYEVLIANYLEAVSLGCCGSTLRHMLSCLNAASPWLAKSNRNTLLDKPLDYEGVVLLHSNRQITRETSAQEMLDVRQHIELRRAVVVVNAVNASFADVMLIIPGTAVLLVQCKFYTDEDTSLGPSVVKKELAKLTCVESLCDVAQCTAKSVIRVIATTKSDSTVEASEDFLLWTTSDEDSLAPLATAKPRPRRDRPLSEEIALHGIATYEVQRMD